MRNQSLQSSNYNQNTNNQLYDITFISVLFFLGPITAKCLQILLITIVINSMTNVIWFFKSIELHLYIV